VSYDESLTHARFMSPRPSLKPLDVSASLPLRAPTHSRRAPV
jgi:hypothetical protein